MTPLRRFLSSALIVVGVGLSVSSLSIITIAIAMRNNLYNEMSASGALVFLTVGAMMFAGGLLARR